MTEAVVIVEKVVHNGRGLARDGEGVIFIPRVIPGEKIKIRITPGRARTRVGQVIEILEPSPERVEPPCPLFGQCGGCDFQHASYPAQLAVKRAVLIEDLKRIAGVTVEPGEVAPSPRPFRYRSRIRLHVRRGQAGFFGPDKAGFFAADQCSIAETAINDALPHLPSLLKKEKRAREVELIAMENGGCLAALDPGEIFTLAANKWRSAPGARVAFRQVNPLQNENLRAMVGKWCEELAPGHVLELYAGAGNLTQVVAPRCDRLVAVDSDPVALGIARDILADIGSERLNLVAVDAADYLAGVSAAPELVILDPPRAGARDAVSHLTRLAPSAVIYVSCDSVTFARDAKTLLAAGYRLDRIVALDMFPQTAHLETAALLTR